MMAALSPRAVYDLTKPSANICIDLINATNGTSFPYLYLAFGIPVPVKPNCPKTQLTITAQQGSNFTGQATFFYDRIDLSTVLTELTTPFDLTSCVNISDLLPQINADFGVNLTVADIVDAPLPIFSGQRCLITIVANPNSLVYIGQAVLPLYQSVALGSVFTNIAFNNPTPVVDFLDLLNGANPSAVPLDDLIAVVSGPITDGSGGTISIGNAISEVAVNTNPYYSGLVYINYNQFDLSTITTDENGIQLMSEAPFTPQSIVEMIAEQYSVPLTLEDLETFTAPSMNVGDITTITLSAQATSLRWTGSVSIALLYGVPENLQSLHQLVANVMPAPMYFGLTLTSPGE